MLPPGTYTTPPPTAAPPAVHRQLRYQCCHLYRSSADRRATCRLPAGSLLAAPLTTRLGALRVIVWSSVLNLAAWPALFFGHSVTVLVAGRILSGLFVGVNIGNSRIYIAEVRDWQVHGYSAPRVTISHR